MTVTTRPQPEDDVVASVRNLRVCYGRSEVVHDVSFELRRGARLGVVGESGSGKSTVARAMLGLLAAGGRVSSGEIRLLDTDITQQPEKAMNALRGKVVSLVFQDPLTSLDPVKTIGNQIAEVLRQHDRTLRRADIRLRCVELLEEVGVDDPVRRLKQYPHEFSGGMRQRVLIAIAIANRPEVLIADEPTTALDVTTQARVLDLLQRTAERHGMSVVLVTHDLGVVAEFCDEVLVMKDGEVVESGSAQEIFNSPREDYTRHLLACIPRPDDRRPGPELENPSETERPRPVEDASKTTAVLKVTRLHKRFGRGDTTRTVLDEVDLTVRAGEIVGVVGESGAGKSTLARCVMRLETPTSGRMELNSADFGAARGLQLRSLRRHVQMVFQDPFSSLDPHMKVVDIVAQPLLVHHLATRPEARDRAAQMLASMGLDEQFLRRLPRSLSGGQRQRVAIARALIVEPDLLVLDEPISALDVSVRAQVLDLLRAEQLKLGTAYLFIVHDLSIARYFCDRIAVLYDGRIVEEGTPTEVFDRPQHAYTQRLLSAVPDPWKHIQPTRERG